MEIHSEEAITAELRRVGVIDDYDLGVKAYPHERLSSRDFELLAWSLFRESRPPDAAPGISWDRASLAQRGPDRGRDILLLHEGAAVGVVQCKGERQRVTLPGVLRELAKVILHLDTQATVQWNKTGLAYWLACASEPARTVVDFFDSPSVVFDSPEDLLGRAVENVVRRYEGLRRLDSVAAKGLVAACVEGASLSLLRPVDLNMWLWKERGTAVTFFQPGSVAMEESAARKLRDDVEAIRRRTDGIPLMNDADLRMVKGYVESVPESHRLSLGFVSLFGFPREMFAGGPDQFRRRIMPIAGLIEDLHYDYMAWMFERVAAEVESICVRPEVVVRVHPFAKQIPSSLLTLVAAEQMARKLQGKVLADITRKATGLGKFIDFDGRMEHVKATLIEEGRSYLAGDYSRVVGEGELLEFKLKLIRFLMQGIADEGDLTRVLDGGEAVLRPHLEDSADRLEELGAHRPAVFIMGTSGLDDAEQVSRMGETLKALDGMKT